MQQDIRPRRQTVDRSVARRREDKPPTPRETVAYSQTYSRRPVIDGFIRPNPAPTSALPIVAESASITVPPVAIAMQPAPQPISDIIRRPSRGGRGPVERTRFTKVIPVSTVPEMSTEQKISTFEKALEQARVSKRDRKSRFKRAAILIFAAFLVLATGYVGVDTIITNNRVKVSASPVPEGSVAAGDKNKDDAKSDMFPGGAETAPPQQNALSSYKVDPDVPRALYINGLNISARVQQMGLVDGAMQSPKNIYDAGWYNGSAKPGQSGAVVLDGHSSETGSRYGLFGYLDKIKGGDLITLERGDGARFNYRVADVQIKALADVDMKAVMKPAGGAAQGLNIITCTGKWTSDKTTLDHRLIVYAVAE